MIDYLMIVLMIVTVTVLMKRQETSLLKKEQVVLLLHDLLQQVDKFIKQDRHVTLNEISENFSFVSTPLSIKLSPFT